MALGEANSRTPDYDPFIEYGPGGRKLDDARDEVGVYEGTSTSAARGVSGSIEENTTKNS
jgi:hypothetical protein